MIKGEGGGGAINDTYNVIVWCYETVIIFENSRKNDVSSLIKICEV